MTSLVAGQARSSAIAATGGWAVVALLALAPIIFASVTWDPTFADPRLAAARSYSLPILVIEGPIIGYAAAKGHSLATAVTALCTRDRLLLTAVVAVAWYSALAVAPVPTAAVARTATNVIHILFGFAIAFLLSRFPTDQRRRLWPAIVLGSIAFTALLALRIGQLPDWSTFPWGRLGFAVSHLRQLGFYALVGSAAALGLAVAAPTRSGRIGWTVAISAGVALSSWSGTRGSIVALIAAAVVTPILIPALRRWSILSCTATGIVGGIILALPLPTPSPLLGIWRMSASIAAGQDVSSGRLVLWTETLGAIARRPVFGHGESQFRHLIDAAQGVLNHPHNSVLQIAFQWGIVGLACAGGLAGPLLLKARRAAAASPVQAAPAVTVLVALLIMSLFEGTLYHPYPIMILAVAIGWLVTLPNSGTTA